MSSVTIVQSIDPPIVAKEFEVRNGKLLKHAVANITKGKAWSKPADTPQQMIEIVAACTSRRNCCLLPCTFIGDRPGTLFDIVPEPELARLLKCPIGSPKLAGIHEIGGRRIAARLKRSVEHAAWILLDADNPPGMPDELAALDLDQRIAEFDRILPGIARVERIECRSSSFRVRHRDEAPKKRGHAWVRISHPERVEILRIYLNIAAANAGFSFKSPRHDRATGAVIGYSDRTLFDTSVLIPGRLVFVAEPRLDGSATAAGYVLDDPDIIIRNEGGGALDISRIQLPDAAALVRQAAVTGIRLVIDRRRARISVIDESSLVPEVTIERRGTVRALAQWLIGMEPGRKLRCETPFRASASEAAFVRKHADGSASLHDVGTGTTYIWHGDNRRVVGIPGNRVVIAAEERHLDFAMMATGVDYGLLFKSYAVLADAWFPSSIEEVVVAWPAEVAESSRTRFLHRLRSARLRVVETKSAGNDGFVPGARIIPPTHDQMERRDGRSSG